MRGRTILVSRVGEAEGSRGLAAALACAGSEPDRAALLVELVEGRAPRPALIASAAARALEERLGAHLPEATVASRGSFCHLALPASEEGLERAPAALALVRDSLGVVHLSPGLLQASLDPYGLEPGAALLRADLGRDRALAALAVTRPDRPRPVGRRGQEAARLGFVSARAVRRPAQGRDRRPLAAVAAAPGGRGAPCGAGMSGRRGRLRRFSQGEDGQVLPLAVGGCFVLIAGALALVAIAGAVTGKGRAQRAADLAAISAARSMRDDLPRLLSPPTLPNGLPNPAHMEKAGLPLEGSGGGILGGEGERGRSSLACGSHSRTCSPSRRCGRSRRSSAS